jgi:hypothetical protein
MTSGRVSDRRHWIDSNGRAVRRQTHAAAVTINWIPATIKRIILDQIFSPALGAMPMVSPVKSRRTHFDNLTLTPAATLEEVAEAFANQISITIGPAKRDGRPARRTNRSAFEWPIPKDAATDREALHATAEPRRRAARPGADDALDAAETFSRRHRISTRPGHEPVS